MDTDTLLFQPCILFVDEMDSLFRSRTEDENSVDRNIKTECKPQLHSSTDANMGRETIRILQTSIMLPFIAHVLCTEIHTHTFTHSSCFQIWVEITEWLRTFQASESAENVSISTV